MRRVEHRSGTSAARVRLPRLAVLAVMLALAAAALGGCGGGAGGTSTGGSSSVPATASRPPGVGWPKGSFQGSLSARTTFLSLWPACACGHTTTLDAFSLKSGRRLGSVLQMPPTRSEVWAAPNTADGSVLITYARGPRCKNPGSFGGCEVVPHSCHSSVQSVNPRNELAMTLLQVPGSRFVTNASASPRHGMLAMESASCANGAFDSYLEVFDEHTHKHWSLGAPDAPCDAIGPASWNASATELVFPYGASRGPEIHGATQGCPLSKRSRLVVTSALHSSASTDWRPIAPGRHCSFVAAAFDQGGIAAVETCGHLSTGAIGNGTLVQVEHRRIVARFPLKRGWEGGGVFTEPGGAKVLVTQSQPANAGYPERDWVWEFDGRQLRAITSYPANDAEQVLALPW